MMDAFQRCLSLLFVVCTGGTRTVLVVSKYECTLLKVSRRSHVQNPTNILLFVYHQSTLNQQQFSVLSHCPIHIVF